MTVHEYASYLARRKLQARSAVPVGAIQGAIGKQGPNPTLDTDAQGKRKGKDRVARSYQPVARVHLITFCHRLKDSDNNIGGTKHLRDCIAASLGLDDADKFIEWNYGQQQTRGEEGVMVTIERIT